MEARLALPPASLAELLPLGPAANYRPVYAVGIYRHDLEMHVQVDPDLSIRDAHSLGGKVKATLRKELPGLVTALIHVEPFEQAHSGDHSHRVPNVSSSDK